MIDQKNPNKRAFIETKKFSELINIKIRDRIWFGEFTDKELTFTSHCSPTDLSFKDTYMVIMDSVKQMVRIFRMDLCVDTFE